MPRLPGLKLIAGRRSTTLALVAPPSEVVRVRIGMTTDQLLALGVLLVSILLAVGYQVLTRWGPSGRPRPR